MKALFTSLIAILILFIGCSKTEEVEIIREFDGPQFENAIASLHPLGDSGVMGTVIFSRSEEGVKVDATITGLKVGKHGFHIHQFGNCTEADGSSAGGHFNPEEMEHSSPTAPLRHMGDMGNVLADGSSTTSYSYIDNTIMLPMIIGRGVIIHAGEDDLSSQPSGAAGSRIACGVIGIAE